MKPGEELGVRVCVTGRTGPGRRILAIREALACQKVAWIQVQVTVRKIRDVHNTILVFGEPVKPAGLIVTNVALLLQPPSAGFLVHTVHTQAVHTGAQFFGHDAHV